MRVFAVLVRLYLSAAMLLAGLLAHAADSARIAAFSTPAAGAALPAGWQPLVFSGIERHTSYELVRDQDSVVIRASANATDDAPDGDTQLLATIGLAQQLEGRAHRAVRYRVVVA